MKQSGAAGQQNPVRQSPLRIGFAGISHETNSFAPGLTKIDAFKLEWAEGKEQIVRTYTGTGTIAGGVIEAADDLGIELLPAFYTDGNAGGTVSDGCVQQLLETLLMHLPTGLDGIVLMLHGAMVSQSCTDMESKIMRVVKEKIGLDCPMAIILDLHANISQQMVEWADLIVGYDTYPHVDAFARGYEAMELLDRFIGREIRPVRALSAPRMLVLPQTMMTDEGPMRQLMQRVFQIEEDPKVISVAAAGGFPYSDVPDAGISFVVTTDGDEQLARLYSDELSRYAWELRHEFHLNPIPPEHAVQIALQEKEGPVILVEGSDNVGGGAPADGTYLLKELYGGISKKALIVIRDYEAAQRAHQLGTGAMLDCEVGGKTDLFHGNPVRINGRIRLLFDGKYRHVGPYMTGQPADMGRTAVVECNQLTIVLTEERTAPWDLGHVLSIGLDAASFHIIVVKSALAWKTAFGDIAKHVIHVDTPGCCGSDLRSFTYNHLHRPVFPLDMN